MICSTPFQVFSETDK